MNTMTTDIMQKEADFADAEYAAHATNLSINPLMFRKYQQPKYFWDWRELGAHLLGNLEGKSLLDLGSGAGEETIYFAKMGAKVTAIDISPTGISLTRERAAFHDLSKSVTARLADALHTPLPSDSFDIVHGLGILPI
jgi:SAM-dependent methyltransferase